jgi:hypothetical protein
MTDPAVLEAAAAAIIAHPELVARLARIITGDGTQPCPDSEKQRALLAAGAPSPVVVTAEQESEA